MIEVRAYRSEDAEAPGAELPDQAYGLTITLNGEVKALGGFTAINGRFWAFFYCGKDFKGRGRVLHSMVKQAISGAAAHGIAPVYVQHDSQYATSKRWLTLLGFRPLREDEKEEDLRAMEEFSGMEIWRHG